MSERIIGPVMNAGLYGYVDVDVDHRCGRCNNGTGVRNPDCPNNRPSQSVPYRPAELHEYFNGPDCPSPVCDRDDHDTCWADFSRQEDAEKYRPDEGGF
jgi:hypothetical protein